MVLVDKNTLQGNQIWPLFSPYSLPKLLVMLEWDKGTSPEPLGQRGHGTERPQRLQSVNCIKCICTVCCHVCHAAGSWKTSIREEF
jgi:hypothetical protein